MQWSRWRIKAAARMLRAEAGPGDVYSEKLGRHGASMQDWQVMEKRSRRAEEESAGGSFAREQLLPTSYRRLSHDRRCRLPRCRSASSEHSPPRYKQPLIGRAPSAIVEVRVRVRLPCEHTRAMENECCSASLVGGSSGLLLSACRPRQLPSGADTRA
jgi:hypothetical protein